MILTAHQPAYLPWLGLFHKIALSDVYIFLDNTQFEKNSFTNRNKIKTANGPVWLTVPVLTKNHFNKTTKELEIDNSKDWREVHWKSIYLNYKKTPFFDKYASFFEDMYKKEWRFLSDLNEYMLRWFLKELGLKIKLYKGSELNLVGRKTDLVLDMYNKVKADLYVFGELGKEYAKEENFKKQNVKIYFQDYKHPVYSQKWGDFQSYMSIIDLLFNYGPGSLEVLMDGNITKKELLKNYDK